MGFAGNRRSDDGYLALVVPVLRGDARCALKVSWIDDETVNEAAALTLWNGGGAVRLLDADDTAGALLLEWLDPRRRLAEVDLSVAVPVAGRLLRRLAVPVPAQWPARPVPGLRQWALDLAAEPGRGTAGTVAGYRAAVSRASFQASEPPLISTGTSLTGGITGTGAADPLTRLRLARCPC
jgi:streptomycin 6-kinase